MEIRRSGPHGLPSLYYRSPNSSDTSAFFPGGVKFSSNFFHVGTLLLGFQSSEKAKQRPGIDDSPDNAQHTDDSAWPNLYASITAPTPTRSTLLSETSSTRTTLARPQINAWVPSSQGGIIENPILIPTLSPWPILK